jgi:hypothetical protein
MKAIGFNSGNESCKKQTRNFLSPLRIGVANFDGSMGSGC